VWKVYFAGEGVYNLEGWELGAVGGGKGWGGGGEV